MHWKVTQNDQNLKPDTVGRDPIAFDQIGRGSHGGKNHPGLLRITVRFKGPNTTVTPLVDDVKARVEAYDRTPGQKDWILTIDVPAIPRGGPDEDQPFEVMVDW
jgi:hypothetical protein